MFKRDHHIRIATILQSLNTDLLKMNQCYFGGGTAIALSHGEYRESVDLDFLISDRSGYQNLRGLLTGSKGINSLARAGMQLATNREIRADQYGIRTMLLVAGVEIKFEIVLEGRITLEVPGPDDQIYGVATLTTLDLVASKLLANSDRWSDDAVFSRDLIDLAMMKIPQSLKNLAIEKAAEAYGKGIERDLIKAIEKMAQRKNRLDDCMVALKIDSIPKALLWKQIRSLR